MTTKYAEHPEPVPSATQLALLPFLATLAGYLRGADDVPKLRVTLHRVMDRDGERYLQQACAYLPIRESAPSNLIGRIFPVNFGIMGAAYETGKIWRTKHYPNAKSFKDDLIADMKDVDDERDPTTVATSYLAVPLIGRKDEAVLILYADCNELNFFADDTRISNVHNMCRGFCDLFDELQQKPFANLRNFPVAVGAPIQSERTKYPRIQQAFEPLKAPRFAKVSTFNYEASVR